LILRLVKSQLGGIGSFEATTSGCTTIFSKRARLLLGCLILLLFIGFTFRGAGWDTLAGVMW
jgi:hypothetical protein